MLENDSKTNKSRIRKHFTLNAIILNNNKNVNWKNEILLYKKSNYFNGSFLVFHYIKRNHYIIRN